MSFPGISVSPPLEDWPEWPVYGLIDDIRPALRALLAGTRPFALATLVEVAGSSPRPLGSQMLIAEDGRVWGYVSGGCVEADVALRARTVMGTGTPETVYYGTDSGNWDIQLTCGGTIGIFVQRADPGDPALRDIVEAGAARRAAALSIDLKTGALNAREAPEDAPESGLEGDRFVRMYTPPIRLLITGGDPVALALAELAGPLGMAVHINRPSGPSAAPDVLAPGAYHAGSATEFLDGMGLDPWTAVVCVSHDLDLDHEVLRRALCAPALYTGALGSRRWLGERLDRLRADGVPEAALVRLRTPVGLDIGARTAAEIALAILADIVAARGARP
ncbi:MAG: XdhC family protein [Alphaproteobacteria bacterium]